MALEDNINNKDILAILKEWDNKDNEELSKLTYKDVQSEEKKLSNAFVEAANQGADPKVLAEILNEWKEQKVQLNQMEAQLFDGRSSDEEPDVFQGYVRKSKENLAKGMNLLTNKTEGFVNQVKEGLAKGGKALTDKIKNAHQNIMTIFHKKQAELSQKLSKFLGNMKETIQDKADLQRVNRWVKATERAESAKIKASETKEDRIAGLAQKIEAQTKNAIEKNAEKFQKKIDNIEQPSFGSRVAAGAKTIRDAVQGKEYKEYKLDKTSQEAADELKNAKKDLEKANGRAIAVGRLKWGIVNAWTNLAVSFNQFKANQYEKLADRSREGLDNIKNEELKDKVTNIREAMGRGEISFQEAIRSLDGSKGGAKDTPEKPMEKGDKKPSLDDFDR